MKTKQSIVVKLLIDQFFMKVFSGVLLIVLLWAGLVSAQQSETKSVVPGEQQQRLDQMKAKGVGASLTILPVRLMGAPEERLSEIVGAILEQQGLMNIELGKTAFNPSSGFGLKELTDSVSRFVKGHPVTTDYVLYVEMNGEPQTHRIGEVRGIVVDKHGEVVWTDSQSAKDESFRQVEDPDPLGYSVLLVRRLSPQMGLNEETAKNAKPGKMAAIMSERGGLPPDSERACNKELREVSAT